MDAVLSHAAGRPAVAPVFVAICDELVVAGTFVGIRQYFPGFNNLQHLFVTATLVGMAMSSLSPVGFVNVTDGSGWRNIQYAIVIACSHGQNKGALSLASLAAEDPAAHF